MLYKERGTDEGANPLIYVIKTCEYKSSSRFKVQGSFIITNIYKILGNSRLYIESIALYVS